MLSALPGHKNVEVTSPLLLAVIVSLTLHLLAVLYVRVSTPTPEPQRLMVALTVPRAELPKKELAPPTPMQEPQIVSPSEKSDPTLPPPETAHRSERDSRVAKEQIKRGEGQREQVREKQVAIPPKAIASRSPQKNAAEPVRQKPSLRLTDDRILGELPQTEQVDTTDRLKRAVSGDFGKEKSEEERARSLDTYEPFSHNSLKKLFSSKPGDADFLPNIPDGDITLLNAKADHYAVFVRRVALQVFGSLRRRSWASLPLNEARRASAYTVIEATLSPQGKLLKIRLTDSSGSDGFDKVVSGAAEEGAWDQNPPPGAVASDGNYHFIFKAKTWARFIPNGAQEQRWILLGTGLL